MSDKNNQGLKNIYKKSYKNLWAIPIDDIKCICLSSVLFTQIT